MWFDQRGSEVLAEPECLRLLAVAAKRSSVGRIAVSDSPGRAPIVHPVNFTYCDRHVLVRLGHGHMAEAATGSLVAFEVDDIDTESQTAWSILARGLARTVDELEVEKLAHSPDPMVPEPGEIVLAIRVDVLTGRRFPLRPPDTAPA
jgi:hypothetical protein